MLFFRQLQHLLPRATAWQLTVDKMLRRIFVGLSQAGEDLREFIDLTWLDLFPETTRELPRWEKQFGLTGAGTEAERRLAYAAAWAAQGGQSPRYLQDVLQAAGFPVYVHEWWWTVPINWAHGVLLVAHAGAPPFSGGETVLLGTGPAQRAFVVTSIEQVNPGQQNLTVEARGPTVDASWAFPFGPVDFDATPIVPPAYQVPVYVSLIGVGIIVEDLGAPVARDPHDYTNTPLIGTVQCGETFAQCTATDQPPPLVLPGPLFDLYPQCNRFLTNDPKYLVNRNLTLDAPPPVPDDPDAYPYFLYIGGAVFGTLANVPTARREELERLLLKLRPSQQWIVTLINYT